jgi:hypothetical protein
MLSEISQSHKDKHHIFSLICRSYGKPNKTSSGHENRVEVGGREDGEEFERMSEIKMHCIQM